MEKQPKVYSSLANTQSRKCHSQNSRKFCGVAIFACPFPTLSLVVLVWRTQQFSVPSLEQEGTEQICNCSIISHASKVMLKTLQARLQQYVNHELPDVQAGFRKGRGTRDQIADTRWIIEKAREFQKKKIYFCFIDYAKAFDSVDHNKDCGKF